MRYRIGETPTEPVMSLDQGAFLFLAILSLAIGTGFVFAGIRSKHYWMAIWGTGLTLSSVGYIIFVMTLI